MTASLNESQFGSHRAYYHGTDQGIKDDVQPFVPSVYREGGALDRAGLLTDYERENLQVPGAYATLSGDKAAKHAGQRAAEEGRLFGSVYEVEPKVVVGTDQGNKYGVPSPTGAASDIMDPEGLKVVRHAGFVDTAGRKL